MIIERKDLPEDYHDMMLTESHHNHEIIQDEQGTLRWKRDDTINSLADKIGLNDLLRLFKLLGYDKNSELYRELYRKMGYSLSGYWEIFYWETNNPDQYQPPVNGVKIIKDFCEMQNETMKNSITPDKGERYRASMSFAISRYQHVINISNALL